MLVLPEPVRRKMAIEAIKMVRDQVNSHEGFERLEPVERLPYTELSDTVCILHFSDTELPHGVKLTLEYDYKSKLEEEIAFILEKVPYEDEHPEES